MDMIDHYYSQLFENEGPVSISFYAPVARPFGETQKYPVRVMSAVKELELKLENAGLGTREIQEIIEEIKEIFKESGLSQHQVGGLAIFMAGSFRLNIYLPVQLETLIHIGNAFELRPLIYATQNNREFYIVVLSQESPRLFKANKFTVDEVLLSQETPKSLAEAISYDGPEKGFQRQAVSGATRGTSPIYHGHSEKDSKTKNLQRFFGLIDQGIYKAMKRKELPVVLAGLESYQAIYKQKTEIPNVLGRGIVRSVDNLTHEEIHQLAWKIIETELESPNAVAIKTYNNFLKDRRTTSNLTRIALASANGQVDTLIVEKTDMVWGLVKPDESIVEIRLESERRPIDFELVNFCIKQTILNGGKVFVLPFPKMPSEDSPTLAVLRY
jgi:hypothetical protein